MQGSGLSGPAVDLRTGILCIFMKFYGLVLYHNKTLSISCLLLYQIL